ncbi:hypothetical protein K502DRAFT_279240, partial [Neoconidiobolus thromboides FSU 785]
IKVNLIGCDFDETITKVDTISLLANLKESDVDWNHFVKKYMTDYNLIKESALNKFKLKVKGEQNWNKKMDILNEYIEEFKVVEVNSINRINESKVLKGISLNKIKKLSSAIPLQIGVKEQLNSLTNKNILFKLFEINNINNINILSLNWSKQLILFTIKFMLHNDNNDTNINIYSNDILFNDNNLSSGNITGDLKTGVDKLNLWKKLIDKSKIKNPTTLYLGDSLNDLPCLLESTFGIIIGKTSPSKQIIDICELLGVKI